MLLSGQPPVRASVQPGTLAVADGYSNPVERGAAGLVCNQAAMTRRPPVRRGHTWHKINVTEWISEENDVEWLKLCICCHAGRHMAKSPNGRVRVLSAQPYPCPKSA